MMQFEEGIFTDLRNLKPGVDASLEETKASFCFFAVWQISLFSYEQSQEPPPSRHPRGPLSRFDERLPLSFLRFFIL